MTRHAARTTVPIAQSQMELREILYRYGATAFGFASDMEVGKDVVSFRLHGRVVRLSPPKVDPQHDRFKRSARGAYLSTAQQRARIEQAKLQAWRALILYVKATCEAIENEVVTVDEGFMPYLVLPDNTTVGDWMKSQMQRIVDEGMLPAILPGGVPK